jgi:hypothetical protein
MNEENRLLDVISEQSNQIDMLEKHIQKLYIWIGLVSLASVVLTLILT